MSWALWILGHVDMAGARMAAALQRAVALGPLPSSRALRPGGGRPQRSRLGRLDSGEQGAKAARVICHSRIGLRGFRTPVVNVTLTMAGRPVASTEHRAATRTPTSPSGRAYARSGLRPNFDFVPRMAGEQGITIGALDTGDGA